MSRLVRLPPLLAAFTLLLPIGAGSAGCASTSERRKGEGVLSTVGGYFADRGRDLMDVVELDGGIGPGIGVDLRWVLGQTGGVWQRSVRGGMDGRFWGVWREETWGASAAPLTYALAVLAQGADLPTAAVWGLKESKLSGAFGSPLEKPRDSRLRFVGPVASRSWPDSFDANAEVHLGVVGLRAGVRPLQLVDFLIGWFGLDLDRFKSEDIQPKIGGPPAP